MDEVVASPQSYKETTKDVAMIFPGPTDHEDTYDNSIAMEEATESVGPLDLESNMVVEDSVNEMRRDIDLSTYSEPPLSSDPSELNQRKTEATASPVKVMRRQEDLSTQLKSPIVQSGSSCNLDAMDA